MSNECPFCKVPCNMPHCPYTKKEEECEDCNKKIRGLEKEKEYLIETIKKMQELFK